MKLKTKSNIGGPPLQDPPQDDWDGDNGGGDANYSPNYPGILLVIILLINIPHLISFFNFLDSHSLSEIIRMLLRN